MVDFRSDIKSSGKFAIFRRLKIEGGGVKWVNYGKIETKDRNYLSFHAFSHKINLKIF